MSEIALSRPSVDSLFCLPAFWRGAIEARRQLEAAAASEFERAAHADALRRLEALHADCVSSAVPDPDRLRRWLAGGAVK